MKARKDNSINHHWWPKALQSYWSDSDGYVSWIDPSGKTSCKKYKNRKIAIKRHAHTAAPNDIWQTRFEEDFASVDAKVHQVIKILERQFDVKLKLAEIKSAFARIIGTVNDPLLRCHRKEVDQQEYKDAVQFILSILIRSPRTHFIFSGYTSKWGFKEADPDVGKMHIRMRFDEASQFCRGDGVSNIRLLLLHSPKDAFYFGDGLADNISANIRRHKASGRALVALTPRLCAYLKYSPRLRSEYSITSLAARPDEVEEINEIGQIYAKDALFFRGAAPILGENFKASEYRELTSERCRLFERLDKIVAAR